MAQISWYYIIILKACEVFVHLVEQYTVFLPILLFVGSNCLITNSADLNSNIFLNKTSGGVISTPNGPFDCTWKITAPPGHVVGLNFTAFAIVDKYSFCPNHYVAIYDTPFGEASEYTARLDKLCGQLSDLPHSRIFSSGRYLSIHYKEGVGNSSRGTGFVAKYSFAKQSEYFFDKFFIHFFIRTFL